MHKNSHSSAIEWWENTNFCFKENARAFSKNSTNQENIKTWLEKMIMKPLQKKFKLEINSVIENLQGELYQ